MSGYVEFLSLDDVADREKDTTIATPDGKELCFRISAMTQKQFAKYRNLCTKQTKRGNPTLDDGAFNLKVIANHVVKPKLNDAALLEALDVNTVEDLLNKKLDPGTITELAQRITQFSGFDLDIKEDMEEAKN